MGAVMVLGGLRPGGEVESVFTVLTALGLRTQLYCVGWAQSEDETAALQAHLELA